MKKYLIGFMLGAGVSIMPSAWVFETLEIGQMISYAMTRGSQIGTAMTMLLQGDDPRVVCVALQKTNDTMKPPLTLLDDAERGLVHIAVENYRRGAFGAQGFDCPLSD